MFIRAEFINHFSLYGSYLGMNYTNMIGFISLLSFSMQFFSGLPSTGYHSAYYSWAFDSVSYIMSDIINGWLMRLLHVLGATMSMLFMSMHRMRGSWLNIRLFECGLNWMWVSGWLLSLISLIEGFLGYISNWGPMSYRGMTVGMNIISVIPYFGSIISNSIWSSSHVITNRIFTIHFSFGYIMGVFMVVHLVLSHPFSPPTPFINNTSSLCSSSSMLFFKDCLSYISLSSIYSIFSFMEPDILGNCDNLTLANSLITPLNIMPEWYFPLFHTVPSAMPTKIIGAILVLDLLVQLYLLH